MNQQKVEEVVPSLAELEAEAEAQAREIARALLQQKLQQLAERHGEVFPPQRPAAVASAKTKGALAHRPGKR
jgi:hypothetical protein